MKKNIIKLIVGLGNPGKEYENTRHNAGRIIAQELIKKYKGEFETLKTALVFEGKIADTKTIVLLPETFMNNSGKALKEYAQKIKPENILIINDDVDIPIGNFKLSFGKHSAGHKGVESVMRALGSINFWRLRIGIAPKSGKKVPALKLILKKFTPAEQLIIKKIKKTAVKIIETAISEGTIMAMNVKK